MTRVLAITRAYGTRAGGMERLSYELLHHLQRDPALKLTILAHQPHPSRPLWRNRIAGAFFVITVIPQAMRAARSCDVVLLGDPVLSLLGWLVQRLLKKPVVVTVHGLDITYNRFLYPLYLRLFFRRFAAYVCISTFAQQALRRWTVRGQDTLITPGITDRFYEPAATRADLAAQLNLPISQQYLLTVGRLVPRKGHAWFIKHVLPHLSPTVTYLIAGTGPSETSIRRAVEQAGVTDRVRLLGRLPDETLRLLYNTVDAFVQPNIPTKSEAEGFGIVLLEAASCGLPVYAANLEGIADAIHSGRNGTLLPSGDATAWVNTLHQFKPHPYRDSTARQYTLEHFFWKLKAAQYRQLLQSLATTDTRP